MHAYIHTDMPIHIHTHFAQGTQQMTSQGIPQAIPQGTSHGTSQGKSQGTPQETSQGTSQETSQMGGSFACDIMVVSPSPVAGDIDFSWIEEAPCLASKHGPVPDP